MDTVMSSSWKNRMIHSPVSQENQAFPRTRVSNPMTSRKSHQIVDTKFQPMSTPLHTSRKMKVLQFQMSTVISMRARSRQKSMQLLLPTMEFRKASESTMRSLRRRSSPPSSSSLANSQPAVESSSRLLPPDAPNFQRSSTTSGMDSLRLSIRSSLRHGPLSTSSLKS